MQNKPKLNLPFAFLMCTIILMGLYVTNSFNPLGNKTTSPSQAIVISSKPFKSNRSLEIHTLALITVTPTPEGGIGSGTSNPIADLAIKTINILLASCGRYVNQQNVSCVQAASPQPLVDRLKISVAHDYNLQCSGFAEAISAGINADIGQGDARTYVAKQIPGYQWIPNSQNAIMVPGDIPVWDGAGCQHIAIVTQVYGTYAFTVAEANGGNGSIDFFQYSRSSFCSLQGWQHKV